MSQGLKGMVLAAGLGSRLRPLTCFRAKPAVPLHNRPLIHYSLELLETAGIEECVVNLHHLPETVKDAVRDATLDIRFSLEESILGTAGALVRAHDFLAGSRIVLINGKILFEESLAEVVDAHESRGAEVTLVVSPWHQDSPFGPVLLDAESRIVAFPGQDWPDGSFDWLCRPAGQCTPAVFTGVHVLEPSILKALPAPPSDTVRDLYPSLIRQGRPVYGHLSQAYWRENSTCSRYLANSVELLQRRGLRRLGSERDTVDWSVVDPGVRLGTARLHRCVVWEDAEISDGCCLENVIVAAATSLEESWRIRNAVLTPCLERVPDSMRHQVERVENFLVWPLQSDLSATIERAES